MRVRIEVSGEQDLIAMIRGLGAAGEKAGKTVLEDVTKQIVALAQPITPVEQDGGALRDSIRATRPTKTKDGLSAGVVAGGDPLKSALAASHHKESSEVYAIIQHEDLTLKHSVGGAKFLERPVMQLAPTVPDLVLSEIDRVAR